MDENILEEEFQDNTYQLRIKMKYLEDDKQKLQTSCMELKQSVQLLRYINEGIVKQQCLNPDKINLHINQLNKKLQESYLRILNENQLLVCENLMHKQILSEAENQYRQILKGYQQKIIQLRRSIQFKQSCIQGYQANIKMGNNAYQIGNVPPSNVSMLFFSQIDELKKTIQSQNVKTKELKNQNSQIKSKNTQLQRKLQLTQNYMKSQCTYAQIKELINKGLFNSKRSKSETKAYFSEQQISSKQVSKKCGQTKVISKQTKVASKQTNFTSKQTCKKNMQLQTRQTSSFESNSKLYQLKNLLKKKTTEFDVLVHKYKSLEVKYKKNEKTRKQLVQGNNFYKQKRQNNQDELNYYKKTTNQLLSLLMKKNVYRSSSANKNKTLQFIDNVKRPQEFMNITNIKMLWSKMQNCIKVKQNIGINLKNKKLKKSLSDVLTYTSINQQSYNIDRVYLEQNKRDKNQSNSCKLKKQRNYVKEDINMNQFSRFLATSMDKEDQFSIIKQSSKITLAERKKMKRPFLGNNLTIIQENIL